MVKNNLNTVEYKKFLKLFMSIFVVLNIVFLYMHFHFFIGNHAWDWVRGTDMVLNWNTGMFEARYAKFLINVALFQGQLLPIFNNIIGFIELAVGVSILLNYWQIEHAVDKILIGLMVVLSPYILGWLYFTENILGNFSAVFFVSLGLYISQKPKLSYNIIAIIMFLLALGVYPSVAETIMICFLIRIILDKKNQTKEVMATLISIIISLILYKIVLCLLEKNNMLFLAQYNMQQASYKELLAKVWQMPSMVINQMITTLPFFNQTYRLLTLCLAIFATIEIIKHNAKRKKIVVVCLLAGFGATILSASLTKNTEDALLMPRINFYGLNFLYAGLTACLFQYKTTIRNIAIVICLFTISNSIKADINAQKIWYLGEKAEKQLIERISGRIEDRNKQRPNIPIMAGEISLRPKYYGDVYKKNTPYLLEKSYVVRHIPSGMYNFYAPTPLFYKYSLISDMNKELNDFLLTAAKPYPAEESLYVDDNYTVMLLTKQGISEIKKQMPK